MMIRSRHHTVLTWLCLAAMVLHSTVLSGGLALCRHADGQAHLELGPCDPDGPGCCDDADDRAATDRSTSDETMPCSDTVLKSTITALWRAAAATGDSTAPPPTLWAMCGVPGNESAAPLVHPCLPIGHTCPSGPLTCLRTVVLLV